MISFLVNRSVANAARCIVIDLADGRSARVLDSFWPWLGPVQHNQLPLPLPPPPERFETILAEYNMPDIAVEAALRSRAESLINDVTEPSPLPCSPIAPMSDLTACQFGRKACGCRLPRPSRRLLNAVEPDTNGGDKSGGQLNSETLNNKIRENTLPSKLFDDPDLIRAVHRANLHLPEDVPRPQVCPTNLRPLVFFHPRKNGGTSIRHSIRDATLHDLHTSTAVPCEPVSMLRVDERVHCDSYVMDYKVAQQARSIAAHAPWGLTSWSLINSRSYKLNQLRYHPSPLDSLEDPPPFDCVVSLRPTVSRVWSCLNYRWPALNIHQWPAEKIKAFLLGQFDFWGHGCNNELVRILSGYVDEPLINGLAMEPPDATDFLVERSVEHGRRCVIVDLSQAENTTLLFRTYLPWLKPPTEHANQGGNRGSIPIAVAEVIHEVNMADIAVETALRESMERQITVARLVAHCVNASELFPSTLAPINSQLVAVSFTLTINDEKQVTRGGC